MSTLQDFTELDQLFDTVTATTILPGDGLLDFDDLDKIASTAVQATKDAKAISASRKALATKGALAPAEREALQAVVRAWELRKEWNAKASVAMFDTQECSHCGAHHSHFAGVFQRQQSKTNPCDRWVASTNTANAGLPKEVKHNLSYVECCVNCAGELGWEEGK